MPRPAEPIAIRTPIAVASAMASLTLPGLLMLFITREDVFAEFGAAVASLLALAITLPVFMIAACAAALSELRRLLSAGTTDDALDELTLSPGRQWSVAFHAGVITNAVMYPGAAVLYFERNFGLVPVLLGEAGVLVALLAWTAARCAYLSIRNEARRRRQAREAAHVPDPSHGLGL